jgi:hypothetical protein
MSDITGHFTGYNSELCVIDTIQHKLVKLKETVELFEDCNNEPQQK